MNDIQFYDKIVKQKIEGALLAYRILLIIFYTLIASLALILPLKIELNPIGIAVAVALILLIIIPNTWRYTKIEYEYSFSAGTFTFSRIYAKKARKTVFSTEIKDILLITDKNNYQAKLKSFEPYDIIEALPSKSAEDVALMVIENDDKNIVFFFSPDQRCMKIFKFFNPQATDRDLIKKFN